MLQFLLFSSFSGRPPEHPPAAQTPVQQSGRRPQHPPPQRRPGRSCSPLLGGGQGPRGRAVPQGGQRSEALRRQPCPAASAGPGRARAVPRSLPARGAAAASLAPPPGAGTCAVPAPRSAAALRLLRRLPRPSRRAEEGEGERGRRRRRVGREKERRGEETRDAPQLAASPPSAPWPRRCPSAAGCAPREAVASRDASLRGAGASRWVGGVARSCGVRVRVLGVLVQSLRGRCGAAPACRAEGAAHGRSCGRCGRQERTQVRGTAPARSAVRISAARGYRASPLLPASPVTLFPLKSY